MDWSLVGFLAPHARRCALYDGVGLTDWDEESRSQYQGILFLWTDLRGWLWEFLIRIDRCILWVLHRVDDRQMLQISTVRGCVGVVRNNVVWRRVLVGCPL